MRGKYCAAAVLIVLIAAGCNHYGALNKDYGNSYNAATYGQILNPGASKNLKPVTGLPNTAADATMKKYADSFTSDRALGRLPAGPIGLLMTPLSLGAEKMFMENNRKKAPRPWSSCLYYLCCLPCFF
jgi:hypothetical protein